MHHVFHWAQASDHSKPLTLMLPNKWQAKEGRWSSYPLPAVGSSHMVSGLCEHRKQVWSLWRRWKGRATVMRGNTWKESKHATVACICHNIISSYVIYIYMSYIIYYCILYIKSIFFCCCLFHQLSDFDPFLARSFFLNPWAPRLRGFTSAGARSS